MKFTRFLDDDKKAPTGIDADKLFTPKVSHTNREVAIYLIALGLTLFVIFFCIAAILITCWLYVTCNGGSTVKEMTLIHNEIATEVEAPIIEVIEPTYETMPICSTTSTFKSWMDYRKITSHSSRQWKLQQSAKTDLYGFRRYNGFYMVAMTKQYGPVGTKYIITFSGGKTFPVIIGDVKANTQCQHDDSSMLEIIVDSKKMPSSIKKSGNYNDMIVGTITEIRVIDAD